ncbi:putative transglutaminase-like cysteine proteinase [Nitrobacteraceae bacterium AZCC 1564]
MSFVSRALCVIGAIACLTLIAGSAMPTEAAAKAKPRKYIFDDLITPSMMVPLAPEPVRAQTNGAKFFSINSVLAKLDGKTPPMPTVRLASITSDDVVSDAPGDAITVERPTTTNEPFGLFTFRAPEGVLWRKWRSVQGDIAADLREAANCKNDNATCSEAARRFTLMVDDVRGREGKARVEAANRLINTAIRYTRDLVQHAAIDVWSSPLASLGSGRGDCEDYAIAKYVLLREAGVAEQDLRVLLVRDRAVREDHAVLAVRLDGVWTVLDNRYAALSMDSELQHFTPLVELDQSGVNMFASPYLGQRTQDDSKAVAPAANSVGADASAVSLQSAGIENTEFATPENTVSLSSGASSLPVLM